MNTEENEFVLFLLDSLSPLSPRAKKMFGGYGLYAGNIFFGIVDKDTLYFKTNEKTKVFYEKHGSTPFAPTEKQILKNYYEVPARFLDDRDTLLQLAEESISLSQK